MKAKEQQLFMMLIIVMQRKRKTPWLQGQDKDMMQGKARWKTREGLHDNKGKTPW